MGKEEDVSRAEKGVREPASSVAAEIASVTGRIRGLLLVPDDDGYDAERAGFQTAQQHRPDVIVGATGAADVHAAVEFAAVRGLPVAVQGTGHALLSVAAEGGVLITTRRMTGVRMDVDARTAWLEAGGRWEKVIHDAAPYGLAPLSGSAPAVGAVSYTLGGGLGLLSRRYGYAADYVGSIDVVTADYSTCMTYIRRIIEQKVFMSSLRLKGTKVAMRGLKPRSHHPTGVKSISLSMCSAICRANL